MVSNLEELGRRDSHLLDRAHSQLPFQLLDAPMQRLDHVPPDRRLLAQGLRRQPHRRLIAQGLRRQSRLLGFGGSSIRGAPRPS